ncbi:MULTISPECIES: isochorismatase family protein [Streptomyces]|uniref:isochorismatase family protein n=1 Tax=Streptomyces TaxID=1883 RepID=UPI00163C05ED|nr:MULTISPECIES: isochorismatase family protein [Streptomyces]MBC2876990.1 isochorismatase family protein [Streptomyces sp. TYQ1024]
MAIPPIAPYPMPTPGSLPENTAGWTVDPRRAVLLVHDMQHYFLRPFPAGQSPAAELVTNVAALRGAWAGAGAPVVYTAQPGGMTDEQRGLLKDIWGAGMPAGEEHRAVVPEVAPAEGDVVLTKWRPSAFCRTGLLDLMRRQERDQLVICGVYAHVGILMSAHEAFSNDIETFVVADAVADFTAGYHRMALEYAATRCAVVLPTAAALAAVAPERAA